MIRKAARADYPRISEIRLPVRENVLARSKFEGVDRTAAWIFRQRRVLGLGRTGGIQGFSAAGPRNGEIFALFIHRDYQGAASGEPCLRESGYGVATSTTAPETRAEGFCRRGGWTEIGREDDGQIIFQEAS